MVAKNGFNALALTVDTQVFGKRRINLINNFNPQVTLEVFKQLGV
jgi:isopentenyl diphosphate isomerase/L-lactate dehydrogenase-like FMN-dependent dehydrogenase